MKLPRLRVAVSIDGLPEHHDVRRKPGTYERILKDVEGREVNIHWTITRPMPLRRVYGRVRGVLRSGFSSLAFSTASLPLTASMAASTFRPGPCVQLRYRLRSEYAGPERAQPRRLRCVAPRNPTKDSGRWQHWNPYGDWIACLSKTENCAGMLGQLGSRNKSRATRCDRVALFSIESRSSCFPIKLLGGGAVLPAPYPVS